MFAIAEQILGGRRVTVLCADGETRMARIPGKMRRRQWVRDGDLIIVWPWDFQSANAKDKKADVKHRYTKTQALYLSRKGVLPPEVDVFGMNTQVDDFDDEDGLFASSDDTQEDVRRRGTEQKKPLRKRKMMMTKISTISSAENANFSNVRSSSILCEEV